MTSRNTSGELPPPGRHRTLPRCQERGTGCQALPRLTTPPGWTFVPPSNALPSPPAPLGLAPCSPPPTRGILLPSPQAARGLGRNSSSPFGAETEMQCDPLSHSHLVAALGPKAQGTLPALIPAWLLGLPAGTTVRGVVGTSNEGLRIPALLPALPHADLSWETAGNPPLFRGVRSPSWHPCPTPHPSLLLRKACPGPKSQPG